MSLTKIIYPDYDSFVSSKNTGTNYGTADYISAGDSNVDDDQTRAFIKFSYTTIPRGSTITGAVLNLTIKTDVATLATNKTVCAANSSWSSSTITWANQPTIGSALVTVSFGANDSGVKSFTLPTNTIISYYKGLATDNGFCIDTPSMGNNSEDMYRFHSLEAVTESNRPNIVITYNPPVNRSMFI